MSVVRIIKKITLSTLAVKVALYLPLRLKCYLTF
jgi:hypothetical protein